MDMILAGLPPEIAGPLALQNYLAQAGAFASPMPPGQPAPAYAVPHTGYAAQVAATLSGNGPSSATTVPTWQELGTQYGHLASGAGEKAVTWLPGLFGDVESSARAIPAKMGLLSPDTYFRTSDRIADSWFGKPQDQYESAGRILGSFLAPGAELSGLDVLRGLRASRLAADPIARAASAARESGYVVPPNMASKNPSWTSQILSGMTGDAEMQQLASAKNADVTNAIAAKDLGLPENQPITQDTLKGIRAKAGQASEAIKDTGVDIMRDQRLVDDMKSLQEPGFQAREDLPELNSNPDIGKIADALQSRDEFLPSVAVDTVQSLRDQAKSNFRAAERFGIPNLTDAARAQITAAKALESLIARNLQAATIAGAPIGAEGGDMTQLVSNLRNARATVAKSYDVQQALNPATGDVSAVTLANAQANGRPLSGGLKQIADAAVAFPQAMQDRASIGGVQNFGPLDIALAVGAGLLTHSPEPAVAALLARPTLRSLILSDSIQRGMIPTINAGKAAIAPLATSRNVVGLTSPGAIQQLLNAPQVSGVSSP